jgi:hypothetical protein
MKYKIKGILWKIKHYAAFPETTATFLVAYTYKTVL